MFVLALSLYNTWNRGVFLLCKITNLLIYRYIFVYKKGILTKIITNKVTIYLGNKSGYAFLIHQFVIRCFDWIQINVFHVRLNVWIKVCVLLAITIIFVEIYLKVCEYIRCKVTSVSKVE